MHVPYKGSAGAVQDLLGGQIGFMFLPVHVAAPYVKSGRLDALAVGSATRSAVLPEVPTLIEQGVKDANIDMWYGLFAPEGTAAQVVARLNGESVAILQSEEARGSFAKQGLVAAHSTPDEFAQLVAQDRERWRKLIESRGISADMTGRSPADEPRRRHRNRRGAGRTRPAQKRRAGAGAGGPTAGDVRRARASSSDSHPGDNFRLPASARLAVGHRLSSGLKAAILSLGVCSAATGAAINRKLPATELQAGDGASETRRIGAVWRRRRRGWVVRARTSPPLFKVAKAVSSLHEVALEQVRSTGVASRREATRHNPGPRSFVLRGRRAPPSACPSPMKT